MSTKASQASWREAESHPEKDYNVIVKWDKITNKGHRDYDQCLGAPFLLYTSGDGKVYSCGMFFEGVYEKDYRMGDLTEKGFKEILGERSLLEDDQEGQVRDRCAQAVLCKLSDAFGQQFPLGSQERPAACELCVNRGKIR